MEPLFKRVICKNIREALDLQYYEQIKQPTFGHKRFIFRDYITHLKGHWCRLDVMTIENLKQHWKRPWVSGEYITQFALGLDKEQEALVAREGIIIPLSEKMQQ